MSDSPIFRLTPSIQLIVTSMSFGEGPGSTTIRITQDPNARFVLALNVEPNIIDHVSDARLQEYMNCKIHLRVFMYEQEKSDFFYIDNHPVTDSSTYYVGGLLKKDPDDGAADHHARSCLRCLQDQPVFAVAGLGLIPYIKQNVRRMVRNMLLTHGAVGDVPESHVPKLDLPRWEAAEKAVEAAMEPLSEELIVEGFRAALPKLRQEADSLLEEKRRPLRERSRRLQGEA